MTDATIPLEAIRAHVEQHFGPITAVRHEAAGDLGLDLLVVEPSENRPWWTLVTAGLASQPMAVPEEVETPQRAELVMLISASHPMNDRDLRSERNCWPIRELVRLALLPRRHASWLAPGHTIAADPPAPFAPGIPFCGMAIFELLQPPRRRLRLDDGTDLAFYEAVPLHPAELRAKLDRSADLAELFDDEVLRVIRNDRPCLVARSADAAPPTRQGRAWTIAALGLLAATVAAEDLAAIADAAPFPVARTLFALFLLVRLLQRSLVARWALVILSLGAAAFYARIYLQDPVTSWRDRALIASIPLWLLAAGILAVGPGLGEWFRAARQDGPRARRKA